MPETSVVLLSEKTGEAVIKVRNTDPYPVILYTSVSDTAEDREPLVVATPLATRLEAGEEQLVRFMLINDEPLRTERMKRVMFEGIPPVMPGKEGVNLTVRQDLPVIVTPRELPVDEQPWKHLSWRVQGRVLTLENPSPYVVRLEQSATIVPKGTVLKLPQRYILPGARVDVSLDKGIVPKHITALRLSTVSRYGYATGAFALIVRLSAPRVGRSGCAPRRYKKVAAVVAATWLAALCALAFPTCSFATTVQFDSHRLQARGLPSALADYYANGSRFGPGYNRVALYVNGSSRGDVDAYFDTHGELCITGDLLERAGLVLPDAKTARTYPPALAAVGSDSTVDAGVVSACYDYRAAFPQTQIKLLPSAARVELIVPPQAVRPRREAPQQFSSGGVAGILNYDVRMAQWRYRQRSRSDVRVRVETGFNAQDWVVRSRQSMTKTARRSEFSHDAAYAQRTFHDAGTILQAGQLYLTNAVTGGAALHGVQLLPDEALSAARPHATHIEGIASSQARVDVTQAGRHLYTTVVPPGPFSIEQFEVPSDALDLIVTVTESDGSQREFVVPATSLAMDAPVGVPGFSLAVGNFSGLDGFYPAVAASAGWRFGSSTSASATTILSTRYQGAAASLLVVPRSGPVIATRLHVSRQSAGSASGARVGIRASGQLGRALSVRLSGGIKTAGFRHHSDPHTRHRQCSAMDFSVRLDYAIPSYGSIGVGYGQSFQAGTMIGRYVTGSISTRIAGISVAFAARCDTYLSRRPSTSTYLSISVPFGRTGTQGHASLSGSGLLSGVRRYDRIRNHTHYSASIQHDHALRDISANLDVTHQSRFANLSAGTRRSSRSSSYSATVRGALAIHGGGISLSPYQIADTFGIASTSGVPGVKISTRAGIVETDGGGYAILPSLPAYAASPVEIATRSLPRNADVDNGYRSVQPARGSVQKVRFNVTTVRRALLDVTTEDGTPMQRGSPVLDGDGNMVAMVLDERRVFVSRAAPGERSTVRLADGRRCQLAYTLSEKPDSERTFERVNARCISISEDR
ncbi:hypothetical protein DFQ28_003264 [Apophysomyces sp. BC1034]|nr:hypothetical protein DFQ28_003264 [Apophysomyces sp. BC1034]